MFDARYPSAMPLSPRRPLLPHPQAPAPAGCAVDVAVAAASDAGIDVHFRLHGPQGRLRIPAALPPAAADGLWQHTCFEAFVAVAGDVAYREFNFSPSGQWAAYAFHDYRERDTAGGALPPPALSVARHADALELAAHLPAAALPRPAAGGALLIGLSAVVEAADGSLSWWALRHPLARPDFHHRDGFALRIELPGPPPTRPR